MNVYVYSLGSDGAVVERQGIIDSRKKDHAIVTFPGGQRVCVYPKASVIYHDMMWSTVPRRNVYIQKMTRLLLERRDKHSERVSSLTRKFV